MCTTNTDFTTKEIFSLESRKTRLNGGTAGKVTRSSESIVLFLSGVNEQSKFHAHLVAKFSSSQTYVITWRLLKMKIKIFPHGENFLPNSVTLMFSHFGDWKDSILGKPALVCHTSSYFNRAVPRIISLTWCFPAHVSPTWSFSVCVCVCAHVIEGRKGKGIRAS